MKFILSKKRTAITTIALAIVFLVSIAMLNASIRGRIFCTLWGVKVQSGLHPLSGELVLIAEEFYGKVDSGRLDTEIAVGDFADPIILVPAGSRWETEADERIALCRCETQSFATYLSWSESSGLVMKLKGKWVFVDLGLYFTTDDGWPLLASSGDVIKIRAAYGSPIVLGLVEKNSLRRMQD